MGWFSLSGLEVWVVPLPYTLLDHLSLIVICSMRGVAIEMGGKLSEHGGPKSPRRLLERSLECGRGDAVAAAAAASLDP